MKPIPPIHRSEENNYREVHDQGYKILNGNVSFGDGVNADNIQGAWGTDGTGHDYITMPAVPNTEIVITHNLNYVPNFYDVKFKDRACDVYASATAWTTTKIYLKCTVGGALVKLWIH